MGKSYKKHPFCKCAVNKSGKRAANKRVRQAAKNPNITFHGNKYKRCYCSWNIVDYKELAPSFEHFYRRQVQLWYDGYPLYTKRWGDKDAPLSRKGYRNIYDRWYRRK